MTRNQKAMRGIYPNYPSDLKTKAARRRARRPGYLNKFVEKHERNLSGRASRVRARQLSGVQETALAALAARCAATIKERWPEAREFAST